MGKYKIYLYSFWNREKPQLVASFAVLFCSKCKWILHFPTMFEYCVYPTMSKNPKQLPNYLKRAETSDFLFIFLWGPLWSLCLYCYHFLLSLYMNQVPEKLYFVQWPYITKTYRVNAIWLLKQNQCRINIYYTTTLVEAVDEK
jgi:hypothetical protein